MSLDTKGVKGVARLTSEMAETCTGHGQGPEIHASPRRGLNDEALDIRAVGLEPHQRVHLKAHVYTESGKYRFESTAEYRADANGEIKVAEDPSLGGSYTGVEPMGLIWSLEPAPEIAHKYPRLIKRDIKRPFAYTFELVDERKTVMSSTSVERTYLADYVERQLINHGVAEGCLYLPKKKGSSDPLPVILDVRGGVPFLVEDRPSLMASHGFATISVNYFLKLMDKKIVMNKAKYFDLQIFLDIFDFIAKHPRLDVNRVAVASSCLGGVLSLSAAAWLDVPIRCLTATGCVDLLAYEIGLRLPDGKLIEPYDSRAHYEVVEKDGTYVWQLESFDAFDNLEGDFIIPVERIKCPMVFFTVGDDQYIPSYKRMMKMKERIEKAGNGHLLEVVHLEGAGHFIDAPYLPLCRQANMDPNLPYPVNGVFGGEPQQHAYGISAAWRKTINYFRDKLNVTEVYRPDWLDDHSKSRPTLTSRL
ncbi:acyl-coenzyme A amino acid N-acyltransferase 1-like [Diadema antillarum]|uniref:acyl-coenzyme A amino acid N-acyltransferase 1-like n=1 Tax=Diadema antillarum TaxID=105358 RepID=UPI003A8456AA